MKTVKITDDMIREEEVEVTDTYFGVDWDRPTINILNAILMDVMAYRRLMQNGQRLVVCCADAKFLKRACEAMAIEVTDDKRTRNKCEVWKLYFIEECPPPPKGNVIVYTKQVDNPQVHKVRMKQGDARYPSLFNPSDNHTVPPGRSPNINKIPPRYRNGLSTNPY